jgi:hypothetical protein
MDSEVHGKFLIITLSFNNDINPRGYYKGDKKLLQISGVKLHKNTSENTTHMKKL